MKYKEFRKRILNGKFYFENKKKIFSFFFNRFFNDVELKSTQKQTISSKQNVHSLTINRADQTDAGIYKAVADNGTGKTVETACTLTVGSMYFIIICCFSSSSLFFF